MFRLTGSNFEPIGLDLGHGSVKLLQVRVEADAPRVWASASRPVPSSALGNDDRRLATSCELIRDMLKQGHFAGRRVVTALPRHLVHVKNFRLPLMPAGELDSAMSFEARSLFPFPPEEALVRWLPAGEVRQGNDVLQEIIVIAVKHADIDGYVERLHNAGVIVDSLDVEPCALYRGVERFIRRREDEQEVFVLVDVGHSGTQVVIGRGREICFLKAIDIGGMHIDQAVARKLQIDEAEAGSIRRKYAAAQGNPGGDDPVRQAVIDGARTVIEQLAREISLCLRYQSVTFRGQRPSKLRLLGGSANDSQLLASLSGALTLPVEASRPLYNVDATRMGEVSGTLGEWAMALGLALRHTSGRFRPLDGRPRPRQGFAVEPALEQKLEAANA